MSENRNVNRFKLIFLLLILSVVFIIIIVNAVKLGVQTVYPRQYVNLVEENAKSFEIDESLLYALIKTESGFDKNAVSSVGAKGLTQITPDTFSWLQTKTGEEYEEDALFEPEISIYYGAYFLDMLLEEFGNTETALAAYHAGRGKVNEWLSDPRISPDGVVLENIPYEDTAGYVKRVVRNYKKYKEIYDSNK
ncbi:MAG: lytic transglycosylase domain-containing protein [Ruminococcaceae bacterium]|nr:lytic transglycosylase domain-containing protein [Oscillospiraceae bacterium]